MKKKHTIASKVDKNWTVLLVDGQGRIRRIRNFRRKLWLLIGISTGALAVAGIMGVLYGGMLQEKKTLADEIGALEERIAEIQQQNELLKARAVRLETLAAASSSAAAPVKAAALAPPETESAKTPTATEQAAPPPSDTVAEAAPASPPSRAVAADERKEEEKSQPQVDAEGLKLTYLPETESIEARFVIKNTGQGPAGGRAAVVLHTEEGGGQLRFALPSVPLRDGRPVGNRGRRFSISRFMTLTLQRRFAEPGTRFVRAVVYAYTLEGRPLLDKPFDIELAIPEKKTPAEDAAETTRGPEQALPTVAPLGLELPEPEPENAQPTGVQP